jgi:hypothetical protein
MKTVSRLLSTEEAIKKFVDVGDVISFGGSLAFDFEAYSKRIKGNLASCVGDE